MNKKFYDRLSNLFLSWALVAGLCLMLAGQTAAQTATFTYQGRLTDNSASANGTYQMQFSLYDALTLGTQLGSTITNNSVTVSNGVFTVQLDFSPTTPFAAGADRWIEISVRKAADPPGFTLLSPRQQITSSPYSTKSLGASSADSLSATCVLCITDAHITSIDASKITGVLSASRGGTGFGPANPPAGGYLKSTGSGWGLAGLSASDLSGVVQITNGGTGSSTKNFVDLSTNQTIAGDKSLTGAVSVTGSGVFNGNGSGLTNLNGANITVNSVSSAALAGDTFPHNQNLSRLGSLRWDLLGQRVSVGSGPRSVAFDGANIWVGNSTSGNVTKFRASDGVLQGTFPVGGSPYGIAFDGTNIWVANLDSNNVMKLRASDGALLGTFPVTGAAAVAFDGANIWVVSFSTNTIVKLRASDGAAQGTFAVGTSPQVVAFDGANVWVTNNASNNVTKLRASDGSAQGTYAVGSGPQGVAFDGSNIWVTNNSSASVTKLRARDGALLGTFTVGTSPLGVAFDGEYMWIANTGGNTVTKLRASDGGLVDTFSVGSSPGRLAFDGASMWVTNATSNDVIKLPVFQ